MLVLVGAALVARELDGPADVTKTPAPDSVRGRAARLDSYLVNYGPWTDEAVTLARRHDLVIAHPSSGRLTADLVARLRGGPVTSRPGPDHTLVVCYVSIGEDLRTSFVTDDEARRNPRFAGDRSGPRVDPRLGRGRGHPLDGIDARGAPSPGGSGYASFYLDDNSLSRNATGDGVPDRNPGSGAYYVNAGDPKWFDALDQMTLDSSDAVAGFKEILTTDHGRRLGCDGIFLDTVDTAAPNHYTEADAPNMTRFEWTGPGLSKLVAKLRRAYPDKVIVQNRGLFYLDNRQPHYAVTTRGSIDLLLFESYRLDASREREYDPYTHADNRFNVAPRLMAEANRPDGFRVLSLGYAEGPPERVSHGALLGTSEVGKESLLEDIRVADAAGFRHAISDVNLTLVNSFVLDHHDPDDRSPPVWTSTFNDNARGWPEIPGPPTPRVGVQEVVSGPGRLTVRWDVALDRHSVRYALYYQTLPFDFAADPALAEARRVVPTPVVPAEYRAGQAGAYPYEATIKGLERGKAYYLLVRAFDASAAQNEEANTVVGFGRPL